MVSGRTLLTNVVHVIKNTLRDIKNQRLLYFYINNSRFQFLIACSRHIITIKSVILLYKKTEELYTKKPRSKN